MAKALTAALLLAAAILALALVGPARRAVAELSEAHRMDREARLTESRADLEAIQGMRISLGVVTEELAECKAARRRSGLEVSLAVAGAAALGAMMGGAVGYGLALRSLAARLPHVLTLTRLYPPYRPAMEGPEAIPAFTARNTELKEEGTR